jgi:YggT family protein
MIPLLDFIAWVIWLYIWVLVINAVLSWLFLFDVINRRNQVVYTIWDMTNRLTEPALRPIRRHVPTVGGLDMSPVVLFLLLVFLRNVVIYGWLIPAFR